MWPHWCRARPTRRCTGGGRSPCCGATCGPGGLGCRNGGWPVGRPVCQARCCSAMHCPPAAAVGVPWRQGAQWSMAQALSRRANAALPGAPPQGALPPGRPGRCAVLLCTRDWRLPGCRHPSVLLRCAVDPHGGQVRHWLPMVSFQGKKIALKQQGRVLLKRHSSQCAVPNCALPCLL